MQHRLYLHSFWLYAIIQCQILIYITCSSVSWLARFAQCLLAWLGGRHVALLGTLENKDCSTHHFQCRHSCLLFTYETLPSERSFVLAAILTCVSCMIQVSVNFLFPLAAVLLPLTEPSAWSGCSLGARSGGTSPGAAGQQYMVTGSASCPHKAGQVPSMR